MRVAVADDLEVEVVGGPAAGEHGVQLLPGLQPGDQAVHGVGGDTLGGMDGGGVAETGRGLDVAGRQPDGAVAGGVPRGQVALLTDMGDGPPVTVLDPVGGREAESTIVGAADDHVADTALVPIRQAHLAAGRVTAEKMIMGSPVEFGDELSNGSEGPTAGRTPQAPIDRPADQTRVAALHGQGSQDATCDDPLREAWCELLDPGPRQVNECMPRTPIGYVADRMTSGT